MNDNEMKEALRLLLKLWNEGGKEAVEAFLAMSDEQPMAIRAEKILPRIQELSNSITIPRGVKTPMITINGKYFEMTRINDWELDPYTIEHIWIFDISYLEDFVCDGLYQRSTVILRDGHLVARIPIRDYVPCFEAYLQDSNQD